ncbi:MAG: hypothetical protein R3F21_13005 [Myxococcota bacterium]
MPPALARLRGSAEEALRALCLLPGPFRITATASYSASVSMSSAQPPLVTVKKHCVEQLRDRLAVDLEGDEPAEGAGEPRPATAVGDPGEVHDTEEDGDLEFGDPREQQPECEHRTCLQKRR